MSDGSSILLALGGTAVGAAASWFFSRMYYLRSGSDLETALRPLANDTQTLIRSMPIFARMLEQANLGTPVYDALGNLTGLIIKVTGSVGLSITGEATATVERVAIPVYDREHEQPPIES